MVLLPAEPETSRKKPASENSSFSYNGPLVGNGCDFMLFFTNGSRHNSLAAACTRAEYKAPLSFCQDKVRACRTF